MLNKNIIKKYIIKNSNKIKINSKDIEKDDIFLALKGKNFHGNKFLIESLNNVFLAPIEMNSHFIIKKSLLVATISGTVGPEAINQGKYAYCAGRTWYSHHHKVIKNIEELDIFLKSYPRYKNEESDIEMNQFLKDIATKSWKGLSDSYYSDHFKISKELFKKINCKDYARVDYILSEENIPFFLEVNTSPGMTETSLFPKSAKAENLCFDRLLERIISLK